MHRVKVLPRFLTGLNRYQCPCGHCENVKNEKTLQPKSGTQAFLISGLRQLA